MKMPRAKIRIRCAALLVLLISTVAPVKAPAASWKQVIVKCSPEDLDRIRAEVGAAIVDAIPASGLFLLTVSSTVDVKRIEAVHGKGSIQASENSRVFIPHRTSQTSDITNTTLPSIG